MNALQIEHTCPPAYPEDIVDFFHVPVYKNPTVLHAKYVEEGLSIAQIAKEFLSSKEADRPQFSEGRSDPSGIFKKRLL